MDIDRKKTRRWLIRATKTPFYKVMEEAKLTPLQQSIIRDRFLLGKSNIEIALNNHVSIETIRNELAKAYDNLGGAIYLVEAQNEVYKDFAAGGRSHVAG